MVVQIPLTGYAQSQRIVLDLAKHRPRLVSWLDVVPLAVENVDVGHRVTQALLVPTRPLKIGRTYTLEIDEVDAEELRVYRNDDWMPLSFEAIAADLEKPRWLEWPILVGTDSRALGCGPTAWATVRVAVTDSSTLSYQIALSPLDDLDEGRVFHVYPTSDGIIRIGHGMCGGPFDLHSERFYVARISAVDAAGNAVAAPGPGVIFQAPEHERPWDTKRLRP
jgi:hypothetical protein